MNVTVMNLPQTISVALLVIAGEFGNGDDRKKALAEAGYDYDTIQACVNALVPIFNTYGV